MPCETNFTQNVCVNAQVRIRPLVTPGDVVTNCDEPAQIGRCTGTSQRFCSFYVRQRLCVEIPITFGATAETTQAGIVCENEARPGNCGSDTACTFSQGYFNNPRPERVAFVQALINSTEDDQIILGALDEDGDEIGLSVIVTPTNYDEVFAGTQPPIPVTIVDPTFLAQYRNLYQQLLAANLNVLNGATCAAALDAISDANLFLATSPLTGTTGAQVYAARLAEFNEGDLLGCPGHCPDDDEEDEG